METAGSVTSYGLLPVHALARGVLSLAMCRVCRLPGQVMSLWTRACAVKIPRLTGSRAQSAGPRYSNFSTTNCWLLDSSAWHDGINAPAPQVAELPSRQRGAHVDKTRNRQTA